MLAQLVMICARLGINLKESGELSKVDAALDSSLKPILVLSELVELKFEPPNLSDSRSYLQSLLTVCKNEKRALSFEMGIRSARKTGGTWSQNNEQNLLHPYIWIYLSIHPSIDSFMSFTYKRQRYGTKVYNSSRFTTKAQRDTLQEAHLRRPPQSLI